MKLKYYIAVFALATLATSCKDWLDVYPKSEITAEKVFDTEEGYYSALAGLYDKMSSDKLWGFELTCGYMEMMGGAPTLGSGNLVTYHANNFYNDPMYASYVKHLQLAALNFSRNQGIRTTGTDEILLSWWSGAYSVIANANVMLDYLRAQDASMFEPGVKELIMGEALAIRAYMHLDLVRIFQLPYTSPNGRTDSRMPYMDQVPGFEFVQSSNTDQILDKVDEDLKDAAEMMKDVDPISSGKTYLTDMFRTDRSYKMNYFAVKALQARSLLYRGKHHEAYSAAKEVIDNVPAEIHFITDDERTNPNYMDGATPVKRSCPMENLFAIRNDSLSINMISATIMTGRYMAFGRFTSNKWLSSNTFTNQPDGFYSSAGDIRIDLWKRKSNTAGMVGKYIQESQHPQYPKQAVSLLRLGEVYLIAAEAAVHSQSEDAGRLILNELQMARNGGVFDFDPLSPATKKDQILWEILLEYRRELIGDGQLFFAYKRRNEPKLITLFQTPDVGGTAYYFNMTDERYTPDIPDKEWNEGRRY